MNRQSYNSLEWGLLPIPQVSCSYCDFPQCLQATAHMPKNMARYFLLFSDARIIVPVLDSECASGYKSTFTFHSSSEWAQPNWCFVVLLRHNVGALVTAFDTPRVPISVRRTSDIFVVCLRPSTLQVSWVQYIKCNKILWQIHILKRTVF